MYNFIRKPEYFDWWDEGCADKHAVSWHLKGIQDTWLVHELRHSDGLRICEVGGGNSRVLRRIGGRNSCVNVDKFEGAGNGPQDIPQIEGVEVIRSFMGDFDPVLEDESFDVVFSISVLEHVPDDALADCFADMARILKPGGRMLHAIDIYLYGSARNYPRLNAYRKAAENPELKLNWEHTPVISEMTSFETDMATNSDQQLAYWNGSVSKLRETRGVTQNCSVMMALTKQGA